MKHADIELEQILLACMVMDNSIIINVTNYISDDDFTQESHRKIFKAVMTLHSDKKAVDIVTLTLMQIVPPVQIAALSDLVPSGANWDFYAKKIKRLSLCRKFRELIQESQDYNEETILERISETARNALSLADKAGSSTRVKTFRDIMPRMCDRLAFAVQNKGQLWGYDTGLANLNEYLCGIQKEYIIIGARPSQGKTALGLNLAVNMAKKGHAGIFFQLEMSDEAITFRAISSESGINIKMLKGGFITSGKPLEKVQRAMTELAEIPIAIEDNIKEIHEIASRIRYLVRCEGYKWAMIDHASKLETKNCKVPRHEQYSEISGIIQDLRKELDIPIILLAQLRRDSEGKTPCLADLRESGSFEQDADTVIFIDKERENDATAIPTDLIIAKQRDGAIGIAKTMFFPQMVTFKDAAEKT